jgi:hypothetical protein
MPDRIGPAAPGCLDRTHAAAWGAARWQTPYRFGAGDPRYTPPFVGLLDGPGVWGRHHWGTDFWVRW